MEIIKLGKAAVDGYRTALADGKRMIPYGNLMVLGEAEVGKSSLVRQLVGMVFLEVMDCTRGIENNAVNTLDSRSINVAAGNWSVKKNATGESQYGAAVLDSMMEQLDLSKSLTKDEQDTQPEPGSTILHNPGLQSKPAYMGLLTSAGLMKFFMNFEQPNLLVQFINLHTFLIAGRKPVTRLVPRDVSSSASHKSIPTPPDSPNLGSPDLNLDPQDTVLAPQDPSLTLMWSPETPTCMASREEQSHPRPMIV